MRLWTCRRHLHFMRKKACEIMGLSPAAIQHKNEYDKKYRSEHGHAYSKEKMSEYNRVYNAKKRGIDPAVYRGRHQITREERFMKYVIPEPNSGCWLWLAWLDKDGYGNFRWSTNKNVRAHVAAHELFKGPVPAGIVVRHTCDNPPCVNPEHILLGTDLENVHDRVRRGRDGKTKLNARDVSEMRTRRSSGENYGSLRDYYLVSYNRVKLICDRKLWKHVP